MLEGCLKDFLMPKQWFPGMYQRLISHFTLLKQNTLMYEALFQVNLVWKYLCSQIILCTISQSDNWTLKYRFWFKEKLKQKKGANFYLIHCKSCSIFWKFFVKEFWQAEGTHISWCIQVKPFVHIKLKHVIVFISKTILTHREDKFLSMVERNRWQPILNPMYLQFHVKFWW